MDSTYFELKTIYEGSKIQIYCFPEEVREFPIYERSEELLKLEDKKLQTKMLHNDGYVWWTSKTKPPTHVVMNQKCPWQKYYIVKKDGNPPEGVQFVDCRTSSEYEICSSELFRVKFIPKIFDLYLEQWVTSKKNIYKQVHKIEDIAQMLFLKVTPEELAVLENLDFTFYPESYDPQTNFIEGCLKGSLPTKLWINLKDSTIRKTVKNVPQCFLQDTMPLYIDHTNINLVYFIDQQGLYWQVSQQQLVDKETAKLELGVGSPVKLVYIDSVYKKPSLYIPLSHVKEVGEGDVLEVFYTNSETGFWVGVAKHDRDRSSPYKRLRLNKPYLMEYFLEEESSLWLVSGEEDIDQLNLAPLKAGERTHDNNTYQVAWVQNNKLVIHSKLFGHKSQIYSIRVSKQQRQQYRELKLQHWLPDPIQQWKIEDLIEYDRLVASGDYHPKPYLHIGQRFIEVPYCVRNACKWDEREFVSRNKKMSFTLYKALTWFEILSQMQSQKEPSKEELVEVFIKAATYGLDKEIALFHLAQNLGFAEVELVALLLELKND